MSNYFTTRPLAREIVGVLILKLIVIFIIKFTFFSDPVEVSEQHLENVFVTPANSSR